ncbi:MAG: hypothetical protein P1V51_02740 [Deltaproteobacteria bacterium]|nr:hypothetical protein [Deltaproteobacteria bacterium]
MDSLLPAELTWGALPQAEGATASYTAGACSNYCHGQTLSAGGSETTPTWTTVDGSQAACGTCHAVPPSLPHPARSDCESCHPTMGAGVGFTEPARHVDGALDLLPLACDACHGSALNAAPDLGAHQSHLAASPWHRQGQCPDCHVVPAALSDPGHADTLPPAELTWGALPGADGATPTHSAGTCTNYCHGQTLLPGGSLTTPRWSTVDGSQAACGTCHGLPPTGGVHPAVASDDCSGCHPFTGTIPDDPARHVDGVVDLAFSCTACHGSAASAAPPADTLGNLLPGATGVGAHQSHLAGDSTWHRAVVCADCHLVPSTPTEAGHDDTPLPAELTWGAVATADGAAAQWSGGTCQTYCHGQTLLPGGSLTTPTWTTVDGSQAACGTCHGLPPAFPHVRRADCESCHPDAAPGLTFSAPAQHIDGVVQRVPLQCNTCHGSPSNIAPPMDTSGNALTTATGVGAHQRHGAPTNWRANIPCDACHVLPTAEGDPGHMDTDLPAELTWGPLANADGAVPAWDGATCSNYCHGQTLIPGGTVPTPIWTQVDGSQDVCGACHAVPPGGVHPVVPGTDCSGCHPFTGFLPDDPATHINGVVDF